MDPPAGGDGGGQADGAPRVSRAMFVVDNVSGFEVDCGGVRVRGTASARVQDFPAGTCRLRADRGGERWTTTVAVDAAKAVRCAIENEELRCR